MLGILTLTKQKQHTGQPPLGNSVTKFEFFGLMVAAQVYLDAFALLQSYCKVIGYKNDKNVSKL